MNISVIFEAQLRETAGVPSAQHELPDSSTVADAFRQIVSERGALKARLLTEDGTIQPSLMVFVNDQPVDHASADSRPLTDGDTLLLLPPISGG